MSQIARCTYAIKTGVKRLKRVLAEAFLNVKWQFGGNDYLHTALTTKQTKQRTTVNSTQHNAVRQSTATLLLQTFPLNRNRISHDRGSITGHRNKVPLFYKEYQPDMKCMQLSTHRERDHLFSRVKQTEHEADNSPQPIPVPDK